MESASRLRLGIGLIFVQFHFAALEHLAEGSGYKTKHANTHPNYAASNRSRSFLGEDWHSPRDGASTIR
jgi:hypothetical protein